MWNDRKIRISKYINDEFENGNTLVFERSVIII